ncbi:MAG: N-acetyltransferase [Verrucomicrobiales bacterium]
MQIRSTTENDAGEIRRLYHAAFPEGEAGAVAKLAVDLLAERTTPPVLSLVAELDGHVAGHVAFSRVTIDGMGGESYLLAPLAVLPEAQKRRIGSDLVESGVRQLADRGARVVFVYGDPSYYGRFGFTAAAAERFVPPYPLKYPFGWQGLALDGGDPSAGEPARFDCLAPLCDPSLW